MPEKKVSAPAADAPAAEGKTRKSAKAPARRGRPPLAPELYVEMGGEQYNITDIIDRAKADYRTTHKVCNYISIRIKTPFFRNSMKTKL